MTGAGKEAGAFRTIGEVADEIGFEPVPDRCREDFRGVRRRRCPFAQIDAAIGEIDRRHDR